MKYFLIVSFIFLLMLAGCKDNSSSVSGPGSSINIVEGFNVVGDSNPQTIYSFGVPHENPVQVDSTNGYPIRYPQIYSFPNPSNGQVIISMFVPKTMNCRIWIENAYPSENLNSKMNNFFDNPDEKVKEVVRNLVNESFYSGRYEFMWNSRDNEEQRVAQGFYRVFFEMDNEIFYTDILVLYESIPGVIELGNF